MVVLEQAAAYYLALEIASAFVGPNPRPTVGPMRRDECLAVQLAIEAAAVRSIASVTCREAWLMTTCPVPGRPGTGAVCPVFEGGVRVSAPPD